MKLHVGGFRFSVIYINFGLQEVKLSQVEIKWLSCDMWLTCVNFVFLWQIMFLSFYNIFNRSLILCSLQHFSSYSKYCVIGKETWNALLNNHSIAIQMFCFSLFFFSSIPCKYLKLFRLLTCFLIECITYSQLQYSCSLLYHNSAAHFFFFFFN